MARPVLKLRLNAKGEGDVWLDDQLLSHAVYAFDFKSEVGYATQVTLKIVGAELDIEVEDPVLTQEVAGECE